MLFDDIKKAKIECMKNRDKDAVTAYNTLINKIMLASIEKKAKNEELTDGDIFVLVQKVEKELEEECEAFQKANRAENVASLKHQIEVVAQYKPSLLSDEEIKNIILSLPDKSVPVVMKHFKENYNGRCDMKAVNQILRTL